MSIANPQLPKVSCKRGAPMGRRQYADDFQEPCRCFRLRFVDGAYDEGGAYFGAPENVYCALSGSVQLFCRADSRQEAKKKFKERYPEIRWIC